MKITIKTIPYKEMRYATTGDYWEDKDGKIHIAVAYLGDRRYEMLVAIHELVEIMLMKRRGIRLSASDDFDIQYEQDRIAMRTDPEATRYKRWVTLGCECTIDEESEPGDDKHAPYYRQHQIASGIERTLAALLDVDYEAYCQANLDAAKP